MRRDEISMSHFSSPLTSVVEQLELLNAGASSLARGKTEMSAVTDLQLAVER
jgi:hypothetical protein